MTDTQKPDNLKKDYEKLVKKALKRPGVADLMEVYKCCQPSYQYGQQYLETLRPVFLTANSDSSTQR